MRSLVILSLSKGLLLTLLLVTACGSSGTTVRDRQGVDVGRVVVESEERATVYDRGGSRVGNIKDKSIFNRASTRVGRVTDDDRIFDRSEQRVGSVRGETKCVNRAGTQVGRLSADIDDEAAAGGCLLLLLLVTP